MRPIGVVTLSPVVGDVLRLLAIAEVLDVEEFVSKLLLNDSL